VWEGESVSTAGVPPPEGWSGSGSNAAQVPAPPPASPYTAEPWARWPYGTGQTYRSGRGLATAVIVLLAVMAVLSLARAGAHANRASLLDDMLNGGFLSMDASDVDRADRADGTVALSNALFVLGLLITGVVFIVWQYRHAVNARALSGRHDAPGPGPGWAIGGWFLPFANLVLPGAQLYGSSRASDPALPLRVGAGTGAGAGSPIVVLWAVVLGVASVIERVGAFGSPDQDGALRFDDVDEFSRDLIAADRLVAVGATAYVVAAVLAIVMVRRLTARQDRRAAALTAAATGALPSSGPPSTAVDQQGWSGQQPWPPAPPASPWAVPGDGR
jgi:hypothetical protein